ncbi:transporter substrate-binding domain-containing protein [Streptomyces sp. SID5464]|nr:transporter substrate-binding domain-containing protein [Streptomyces sp. SID5464]
MRTRPRGTTALALLPALALTACGSGGATGTGPAGAQSPAPTADPVAAVHTVDSVAALLPADVRRSGTLRIGSSVGSPPGAYYPNGPGKAPAGQDIDITDAVAKVLGVKPVRQDASFETILPALGSGKYDVGDTTQKDSGLAEPLADALNHIIGNGTYAKVLKRWGLSGEAVTRSETNPPGLPKTGG